MNRLLAVSAVLLAAVSLPVAAAAPAYAKGATSVTVTGPGIAELEVDHWTRTSKDVDLGKLSEVTGIYGIFGAGTFADEPDLTAAELGPRYDLTWYQADAVMAVSHVYPFAEGGAWGKVPDGQRLWGDPISTGWWHGGPSLESAMVELGATVPEAPDEDSDTSTTTAAIPAPSDPPSSGSPLAVAGGVAAGLLVVTASVAWLARRRRTPHPVITLSEPA